MASEPKKHHFVPRGYLRFFAQEIKEDVYQIAVFDKTSGKRYLNNIDDVAEMKNYNRVEIDRYNMPVPDKNPLYYEHLYPRLIEDDIPKILRRTISSFTLTPTTKLSLGDNLKAHLARMLVIQMMRTPRSRSFFTEVCQRPFYTSIQQTLDFLATNPGNRNWHAEIEQLREFRYTNEFAKSAILSLATSEERIAHFSNVLIDDYCWMAYSNQLVDTMPFITSDEPVLLTDIKGQHVGLENNPLARPTTMFCFAINSQYMLSLHRKDSLHGSGMKAFADQCLNINDMKYVVRMNLLHIEHSTRQVFTHPKYAEVFDILKILRQ